jgi:hypothetical protein
MTTECLFVLAPLTLAYDFNMNTGHISFFLTISSFLVIPFCLIIQFYSKQLSKERLVIKYSMIACLISCLGLIQIHYLWKIQFIQFGIFFMILFILSNLLESIDSSLLAKIMTGNIPLGVWKLKTDNSGFIIILTTTIGRFVGASLVSIFGIVGFDYIENLTFIFFFISYGLMLIVVIVNYNQLKVKSILRIIVKRTEGKKEVLTENGI